MRTTDALRAAVTGDGDERVLTLDRAFQGLPDTAHGGAVLAVLDLLAARPGPRTLRGHYLRRVPPGVPLRVRLAESASRFTLQDATTTLVEGTVEPATEDAITPAGVPPEEAMALPVSRGCFACGSDNPLGLGLGLRADDDTVGGTWPARPGFARDDGTLAPVALTTLLDEAAFWLGALATGEAGMTTELRVTLHAEVPAAGAVTISGARSAVRSRADDSRYWETAVAACDVTGRLVASAAITFVAVRGAARKLAAGMLAVNPPAVLRRVFPAYVR